MKVQKLIFRLSENCTAHFDLVGEVTQEAIEKLIVLLECSKDTFPTGKPSEPIEPKHEPFLIRQSNSHAWQCTGCYQWHKWNGETHEDSMEHCPNCCGSKIKCPAKQKPPECSKDTFLREKPRLPADGLPGPERVFKHEPPLIQQSYSGGWQCNGCDTWYSWTGESSETLQHCPNCCGSKIKCPARHNRN